MVMEVTAMMPDAIALRRLAVALASAKMCALIKRRAGSSQGTSLASTYYETKASKKHAAITQVGTLRNSW
jgi:hypothetical protein